MTAKERLLFVIPNLAGGGAERVVSLLSEALAIQYDVHIAVFQAEATYGHGGTLHDLAIPPHTSGMRSALRHLIQATLRLRRLKRQLRPSTCISFMSLANFCNILSRGRERVIASVRTIPSRGIPASGNGRLVRGLIRALYPRADKVIALSEGARADIVRNFSVPARKVVVIYNPLSHQYLSTAASEAIPPAFQAVFAHPTIVAVGRLVWEKGHARLIRIFAELKAIQPAARLLLVGKGPLRDKLVALARSLGLTVASAENSSDPSIQSADVILTGFVEKPMGFVRHATAFAFPSHHEGLGQALLEALATGTPVIASDCESGPRELLAPGCPPVEDLQLLEFASHGILAPNLPVTWPESSSPLLEPERQWVLGLSRLLEDGDCRAKYRVAGQARAQQFAMSGIIDQWKAQFSGQ